MPSGYGVFAIRPRQDLYTLAARDDRSDRGTYDDCSQETIDRATHFRGHHSGHYVSSRGAVDETVRQNDLRRTPGLSERDAIDRLRYAKNRTRGDQI